MQVTREQKLAARQALSTTVCEGCGRAKRRGEVFCRRCYWRLPTGVQRGLYQSAITDAYAEAYAQALAALAGSGVASEPEERRLF